MLHLSKFAARPNTSTPFTVSCNKNVSNAHHSSSSSSSSPLSASPFVSVALLLGPAVVLRPAPTSPAVAFSPTKSRPVHSALQRGQRRLFGCERKKCCVQMLCRRQGQSRLEQRWPCEQSVSQSISPHSPFCTCSPGHTLEHREQR